MRGANAACFMSRYRLEDLEEATSRRIRSIKQTWNLLSIPLPQIIRGQPEGCAAQRLHLGLPFPGGCNFVFSAALT